MNILFVINSISYADHISISYLSAVAKKRGHKTFLCILDNDDLEEKIKLIKPEIVAYSVNIIHFKIIVEEHKKVKDKYKFVSIMGGPHVTFSPDTFLESGVDAYCVGEGELPFNDFIEKIENNDSFDDVDNLITKNKKNPVRPLIKDLGDIPFPDRDLVISNSILNDTPKKTFYATRGCPFNCNYCCNNHFHKIYKNKGKLFRRFPVDRLISEIEYVKKKYRMEFIKFGDDLFAMSAGEWMKKFVREYKSKINVPFNCYLRIDMVNDDLLRLLKKAGCFSVHLSVDSTSEHIREDILGRKMKKINIEEKLKKIKSYGINTWVNFMLAVPESSLQDDINAISLAHKSNVTYASFTTTDPMKGTKLYDYCIDKKYVEESYDGDMSNCYGPSVLSCFSEKDKDIRYNIYCLGPIASKLRFPFNKIMIFIIKHIRPNKIFKKIRRIFLDYNYNNKIFILKNKR